MESKQRVASSESYKDHRHILAHNQDPSCKCACMCGKTTRKTATDLVTRVRALASMHVASCYVSVLGQGGMHAGSGSEVLRESRVSAQRAEDGRI